MSKHILQKDEVKNTIETVFVAIDHYWSRPTEWPNQMKSDVLYATVNSKDMQEPDYEQNNQDQVKAISFKFPCYLWANQCFILSKESISSHMGKTPLNPIVALGSFIIEQKQSLVDHAHRHDPFLQNLYSSAKHIFQK
ncbi:hypothetical protein PS15m_009300 [Mucor circinelloides]